MQLKCKHKDGAEWLAGKRLNGSDSQDKIMEWVKGLGLNLENGN